MKLIGNLLDVLPAGRVGDVHIGLHWTAVVVEVDGTQRCGLASPLTDHPVTPNDTRTGSRGGCHAGRLGTHGIFWPDREPAQREVALNSG